MKKFRKLIPAIAMLLMSAVMMSTSSFAWFSISKEVTVSSMQVKATASGSLVVNMANADGGTKDAALKPQTSVSFTTGEVTLHPCTFFTTDEKAYAYYTGTTEINPSTGLPGSSTTAVSSTDCTKISEKAAVNGTQATTAYYVDYIVYLSAAAQTLSGALTADVTFGTDATALANDQLACTVHFYVLDPHTVNTTTSSDYDAQEVRIGTRNPDLTVVAKDATNVDGRWIVENKQVVSNVSVPLYTATSNNACPVLMRVFFDGNLLNGNVAYINSTYTPTVAALPISVNFTVGA